MTKETQTHLILAFVGGILAAFFLKKEEKTDKRRLDDDILKAEEKGYFEGYEDAKDDYGVKDD
jgi:hypothetical protein